MPRHAARRRSVHSLPHRPPLQTENLLKATDVLRNTKFHAFPVIRPSSEGDVYVGTITREHLTVRRG